MFTSDVQQAPDPSPNQNPQAGVTQDNMRKNKTLKKTYITCRFRIYVQQNMCHVPFVARQVVQQIQKADPVMNILPFSENETDDKVLDSHTLLPGTSQDMGSKYIYLQR